ncbi:hypothetical protein LMH87_006982 [Akanthomyces muscarius]|uniref:RSE1/DDB1/CPSF1 first beta-propeller domain-containing protein n=1 Tax=Akanthomyces muscarius TaxID=2231603 RepID=A0A9W8QNT7_AKAMU|nr:hypothetical protein LMH87_006982 [Akanthomyces muscarius]KAJ4165348.1 hypothetical protein LMH87_006982 [Akanthomyces muscarius]
MAFQTNVLRDGQWVTETVNLATNSRRFDKNCANGYCLHRGTFRPDHAVVLGVGSDSGIINGTVAVRAKSEDGSPQWRQPAAEPDDSPTPQAGIPPQVLALMLENGDIVFLFLRKRPDSTLEFVVSKHKLPRLVPYIGYHLAVDPSSRYMAASTPEGVLIVYELQSWTDLKSRYIEDGSFSPIRRIHLRTVQGVIHNMNFLFPRPEDDYHIILLLIVIRKERPTAEPVSRMLTYDWELGDNLKTVFHEEKTGNRLPAEHKMPILLIPLKFKTAFFAVSKNSIGVVKHALSGSPEYERLSTDMPKRTKFHNGKGEPLWTAWTRPARRHAYFQRTDIIFLAREDGAFIFVDIDQKEMVPSVINVGCLETNINTAFATSYDLFSDVLIVGGDSGPGGVWKLAPRTDLDQVNVTPNWSPVVDVATTYEPVIARDPGARQRNGPSMTGRKPDSIFTASGRGCKGSITQWRSGVQAKIGLDIESGEPNKQAWIFPVNEQGGPALFGILTLPHSTRVLQFAKDFSQVQEIEGEDTLLDLSSRTLFATQQPDSSILQITEAFICITGPAEKSRTTFEELLGAPDMRIDKAHSHANAIILCAQDRDRAEIFVVKQQAASFNLVKTWTIEGEVTAVSLLNVLGERLAAVASIGEGQPSLSLYTLDGHRNAETALSTQGNAADSLGLEAITSICAVDDELKAPVLVLGTSLDDNLSEHVGHMSLLMLAGSRILMTDIWPQVGLVPRSMTLEGSPSRVIYSRTWKCLIVALLKNDRPTLEFLDPETGAMISDPSDKEKNSSEFISGLGHEGDRIYGLHEWLYVKDGRTFSFILVTTKDGRLLIVSLKETEAMTEDGAVRRLKYWTRYKKWLPGPVSAITGDADGLIFCVDRTLHWEVLDLVDKKLKPMKEYQLDSPAVQLKIVDGKIHALTLTNSLEIIDHRTNTGTGMLLLHTDQVARRTIHMLDIGSNVEGSEAGPVTLLADYRNGFAGVWVPHGQDNHELQAVFEGLLPSSVRRFVKTWSRPPWVAANRALRYGALPSSNDGAEILGVGLDGALYQFTLIEVELWRLLCLIQTLAHRSPLLYPLYNPAIGSDSGDEDAELEPQLHPRLMHIDGDILEKCTEWRVLEKIVGNGDGLDLFCEYLDGIEGGLCTGSFRDSTDEEWRYNKYFEVAYDILEYLLAPVI